MNAYLLWNEHWEHWAHKPSLEERPEYPYQNVRTKNFFWGDGDKVSRHSIVQSLGDVGEWSFTTNRFIQGDANVGFCADSFLERESQSSQGGIGMDYIRWRTQDGSGGMDELSGSY